MANKTQKLELKIVLLEDGINGFFSRGKIISKLVDEGKSTPKKQIITFDVINFDGVEQMLALLLRILKNGNN